MLVPYQCCTQSFIDHYSDQQSGNGILNYYRGYPLQRGHGIGGFFAKLFRSAVPLLMKGAKTIGKEALRTGSLIASDVLAGEKFKTAAQNRARESGKLLARKALKKADEMIGRGIVKKKRKLSARLIPSKVKKVARRDIFDP